MTSSFDVLHESSLHTEEFGEGNTSRCSSRTVLNHPYQTRPSTSDGALSKPSSTALLAKQLPRHPRLPLYLLLASRLTMISSRAFPGAVMAHSSSSPPSRHPRTLQRFAVV